MDLRRIQKAVRELLEAIGEEPEREGLRETPERVARMCAEIFEGVSYTNDDLVRKFDKCFEANERQEMVLVRDIECFSVCEHHLALIYNMRINVGYLPQGKVIGLSKIARIADMVCKRPQIQERIGSDIGYILSRILGTDNVAVLIEAEHACMAARGIKKPGCKTRTLFTDGVFASEPRKREEFISLCR